jgi:molecular chaperone DnaJ
MNKIEALNLLELEQNSNPSESDIQTAFRKLAKKYHPDINKNDPEAESKFKKINEAKDYLLNPQPERNQMPGAGGYGFDINFQDIFAQNFGGMPFGQNQQLRPVQLPTIVIPVTIDFSESVLGCDKNIVTDQHFHCQNCRGAGQIKQADNCKHCNGKGMKQAAFTRGNMTFMSACDVCNGVGKQLNKCDSCSGKGFTTQNGSVTLSIPGGVVNGAILRNHQMILQITVNSDPDMRLERENVITTLELSLLEALKGTKKTVRTVKGEMNLKIPPKVKNKDNIMVHGYGVPSAGGSHIFDVRINYPENVDNLIEFLEK